LKRTAEFLWTPHFEHRKIIKPATTKILAGKQIQSRMKNGGVAGLVEGGGLEKLNRRFAI